MKRNKGFTEKQCLEIVMDILEYQKQRYIDAGTANYTATAKMNEFYSKGQPTEAEKQGFIKGFLCGCMMVNDDLAELLSHDGFMIWFDLDI